MRQSHEQRGEMNGRFESGSRHRGRRLLPATLLYNTPHHHSLSPMLNPTLSPQQICRAKWRIVTPARISQNPNSRCQAVPMDKALALPPGFRFHPTDEELVVQYLRRKVFSYPLPASIIPEIHLGRHNPWDLLGVCEQERYFFSLREAKYANGTRSNRAAGSGYWKATGKDKPVVSSRCNRLVGTKKVLVFYQGKAPGGQRTDWIMHEYHHLASPNQCCVAPMRDWVLCRIFKKQRATKIDAEFMNRIGRPSSPSGSDSSCVTAETSDGEDVSSSP